MTASEFNPDYILPGQRIGVYVIRNMLGYGGCSTVYEVESPEGHRLALKMCRYAPGPPRSMGWLMDQRQSRNILCLEQLRSTKTKNVAHIYAHDRHPDPLRGHQYLVQELVPGGLNIANWVRQRSPSLVQIVTAFLELADLFAELADAGVRCRDVKPDNILVTPEGTPKIVDFDSAICFNSERVTGKTAGDQPGSKGYFAPEVCLAALGEKRTGERKAYDYRPVSDLHGLGVVFYEVLTGQHAFNHRLEGDDMLREAAFVTPHRVMDLNDAVPFGLNKVVMKLLEKDPDKRHQHGDELADDLESLLDNVADDSWAVPFKLLEHNPEGPAYLTDIAARAEEPPTLRRTPEQTPLPSEAQMRHAAQSPVPPLPVPQPKRSPLWGRVALAAVFCLSIGAGVVGGLRWPAGRPALARELEVALESATCSDVKGAAVSPPVCELPSPPAAKKVLRQVRNAAALTAATALCASCAGVKVRPEDELAWLASCPDKARETVRLLGIHTGAPDEEGPNYALLYKQPNVIPHETGCEVREGKVLADAVMSPLNASGVLIGTVREGSDRVFFRFHELEMADGHRYPICAIGGSDLVGHGPGVAKAEDAPSERTPNFIWITTGRFKIRVAPFVPSHASGGA